MTLVQKHNQTKSKQILNKSFKIKKNPQNFKNLKKLKKYYIKHNWR